MMTERHIPRIIVTTGEPAGIGPDVSLHLAFHNLPIEVILLGDHQLLEQRAKTLGLNVHFYPFDFKSAHSQPNGNGMIGVAHVDLIEPTIAGQLSIGNVPYVINLLKTATDFCLDNLAQAMISAPIHKAIINEYGMAFCGHTEFLGDLCNTLPMMTFYNPNCILGLATTHIPLSDVSQAISKQHLETYLELFIKGLKQTFKIAAPRIAVLGLNPHAGEAGNLGREEIDIIQPVIEQLANNKIDIHGPIAADTAFSLHNRQQFDAFFAMYHDQGLTPMKALYFTELMNVTLGLPFLRTSVDHGTACHLAATGQACPANMMNVLTMTHQLLAQNQHDT